MQSKWSSEDYAQLLAHYQQQNISEDIVACLYASRLLGQDSSLVLHGGGNSSVKSEITSVFGQPESVLFVKGSGWDMAYIEPAGFPAVKLKAVCALDTLDTLSDEDMVNYMRSQLTDQKMPNPSIETLMHALLPEKFVLHCHANAIVALANQANAETICQQVFAEELAIVPYIKPGFDLSIACAQALQNKPDAKGLLLLNHGLVTFAADAKTAYENHIHYISLAEAYINQAAQAADSFANIDKSLHESWSYVLPMLRRALDHGTAQNSQPVILKHRYNSAILNYIDAALGSDIAQRGTVTPEHVIRTKRMPMILPSPANYSQDEYQQIIIQHIAEFESHYQNYFTRNQTRLAPGLNMVHPKPDVVYIQDIGLFGVGRTAKAASVIADMAEATIAVISDAERIGSFSPLSETDAFDIEYWPLERIKLEKARPKAKAGQIVVILGTASAITEAIARQLHALGAEVTQLDTNIDTRENIQAELSKVVQSLGDIDILISNTAAAAHKEIINSLNDLPLASAKIYSSDMIANTITSIL